jgi:hypothetical protein
MDWTYLERPELGPSALHSILQGYRLGTNGGEKLKGRKSSRILPRGC